MLFSPYRLLFSDPVIWLLLCHQLFTSLASRGLDLTLVWIALQNGASYSEVGFLVFFRFLPYAFFGLLGGWFSDRYDRKKIIILSDLLRGGVLFGLVVLVWADFHVAIVLSGGAFLLTTLGTIFQPAYRGILQQLVRRDDIAPANSILHSCHEVCGMVAPVLFGLALSVFPEAIVLGMSGVLFLVASFVGVFLKVQSGSRLKEIEWPSIVRDYRGLWRKLGTSYRNIRVAIVLNALSVLGVGGLLGIGLPVFFDESSQLDVRALGLFMGSIALGTLPGAFFAGTLSSRHHSCFMYLGWLFYGVLIALTVTMTNIFFLIVLGSLLGFSGAVADVLFITVIQRAVPEKDVSKAFAIFSFLANSGEAISGLLVAWIAGFVSVKAAFVFGGAIVLMASLSGLLLEKRMKKELNLDP